MRSARIAAGLVLLCVALAAAEKPDFEGMGFEKKEVTVLQGMGVQTAEDVSYIKAEDIAKVSSLSVVGMRRLEEKVNGVRAIEMINKTDITGICVEMAANRMNARVQAAGAAALVKLISKYRHSTYRIEQIAKAPEGAVFALARAMEIHFEVPEVVEHVIHGLNLLAFTDNTKSKIGQAGGVDAIIVALSRHGDKAKLMQHALRLIAKVVFNDNIKKALGTEDNIKTILNLINKHELVPGMLDEACMALWQITSPSQYCLHMAAKRGYIDAVNSIIKIGGTNALLTKDIETGDTALHVAALHGQTEVVRSLIDAPGGIELMYEMNKEHRATALHMAAATGKKDIVAILLEKGGDRLAMSMEGHDGKTPFLVALERGMINVCDYLMTRQGKDILLAKDQFGNSAMHLAGGAGSAEAVKWLLEQGMNEHWLGTNMNGMTAPGLADLNEHNIVGRIIAEGLKETIAAKRAAAEAKGLEK